MRLEDILDQLENDGYTIIAIMPNDDPYKRKVVIKDTSGNTITKEYVLIGFENITDDSGNIIGVEENWQEV